MLQLLKELKLHINLGPETLHKVPISIHIKITRLPAPAKVFLQLKHNAELLLHL